MQVKCTDLSRVSRVKLGDVVLGKSFAVSGLEARLSITAYVSAANTVNLLYANNTAGAIDVLTGVVKLVIVRPAF